MAVAIIASAGAKAPFVDTSKPASYVPRVDVHAGVGVSTILQNYSKQIESCADFFLTPGCQTVMGVKVELPIRKFFHVGTGLDYAISNYNWSMTVVDAQQGIVNTLYNRNNYHAIEIPVYMSFRFTLGAKAIWNNELGFYLSQGVSGKSKYKAYISSTNDLGQSQVTSSSYERKYYKDPDPVINGFSRTDYGFHIATGLIFRDHWSLNAVLRTGLCDMARNMGVLDINVHNLSMTFRLGYMF